MGTPIRRIQSIAGLTTIVAPTPVSTAAEILGALPTPVPTVVIPHSHSGVQAFGLDGEAFPERLNA